MATKIFVGSLPSGCKPEELRHLFETFGVVTECDVMNRCGFVHMENADMAETAIKALNSTEFKGETINVEPGRIRGERNQKAGNKPGASGLVRNRNRGRMGRAGPGPQGMEFDGIDDNVTKDALQICSAVFEEMNKMLNPNMSQGGPPRRGGGGNMAMALPKNFASQLEMLSSGGLMDGGNRTNNRSRQRNNRNNNAGANQGGVGRVAVQGGNPVVPKLGNAVRVPNPAVNVARVPNQAKVAVVPNNGNAVRGQNQGNAVRAQNQGNANKLQNQGKPKISPNQDNILAQGANRPITARAQTQGNLGRAPKQGNVGPIRNDPPRTRNNVVPYNRGNNSRGNSAGPHAANINFADDIPIAQNARTFANNLASGSQIDNRWQSNNGNFGVTGGGNNGGINSLMGRNFDEDIPVTNFSNDAPMNNAMGMGNNSNFNNRGSSGMGNQGNLTNHGNFGSSLGNGGGNDRYQNSGSNNDRFQTGGNYGMGNQDRRGFALPERQNFNDNHKFVNQDFRRDNSQQGGLNTQNNLGVNNRDFGFGNNSGRQESRNMGGIGGGNMGGNDNAMFTRRNNNSGNLDGNNMGNNRMRNNDMSDNNSFGGNFGGNNTRGGNSISNSGFNRNMSGGGGGNNSNMGGGMNSNMAGANRNMGGGANNNRNNMGSGNGNNNNRNNMGSGNGNNNNRNNMGSGNGNNNNRNNMGGNNMPGSLINPLNFQKDFPALSIGLNMNDRNGPRQNNNMMSNRRW